MVFTNQCRQGCHLHHQHHHILITITMTLIIIITLMLSIYLGAAAKPKHSSRTIRAGPWRCWRAQVSREVPHQVIVNIIMIIIIIWMIVIPLIITTFRLINIGDREDEEGIRWSFELCQQDQQRVILKVFLQRRYWGC